MTNVNDLKAAIKDILQSNGTLDKIRAEIRESIYHAIETNDQVKPKLPEENLLINELIREYMHYNGYYHSASVFISESGQPEDSPLDRNFIAKELNVIENNTSKNIPLLYSLIYGLKKDTYEPNDYEEINSMNNKNNTNNFNSLNNNSSVKLYNTQGNNKQIDINTKDQPKGIIFNK